MQTILQINFHFDAMRINFKLQNSIHINPEDNELQSSVYNRI